MPFLAGEALVVPRRGDLCGLELSDLPRLGLELDEAIRAAMADGEGARLCLCKCPTALYGPVLRSYRGLPGVDPPSCLPLEYNTSEPVFERGRLAEPRFSLATVAAALAPFDSIGFALEGTGRGFEANAEVAPRRAADGLAAGELLPMLDNLTSAGFFGTAGRQSPAGWSVMEPLEVIDTGVFRSADPLHVVS